MADIRTTVFTHRCVDCGKYGDVEDDRHKPNCPSWAQRMRDKGFKRRPVLQSEPEEPESDPKNYKGTDWSEVG